MIAADTSSMVAFLKGESGKDVEILESVLESQGMLLPPIVVTELLSDPKLPKQLIQAIKCIPILEILPGLWERAGLLRAKVLAKSLKARVGDTIIAQICIDHDLPIITRDKDFRHFVKISSLKVLP